jgi:hypothetical protein
MYCFTCHIMTYNTEDMVSCEISWMLPVSMTFQLHAHSGRWILLKWFSYFFSHLCVILIYLYWILVFLMSFSFFFSLVFLCSFH